jgi:hypothetical protein
VTITTGAALAPDDGSPGNDDEDRGISVEAGTSGETGVSFVFVPHVIGGISLTVAPDVVNDDAPQDAPGGDSIQSPGARPELGTVDESVPEDRISRADRARGALPFTGPGLTGLGGVILGCLVVGTGAAVDLGLGDGLGVGFTATFLLGCALVASALRTRALTVAVVLPPLLFAAGYALETKASGQTTGRRQMALDVATSLALHAPVLFIGTVLAVAVVLVRVVVHLVRR